VCGGDPMAVRRQVAGVDLGGGRRRPKGNSTIAASVDAAEER
jgi:hypothetical protein